MAGPKDPGAGQQRTAFVIPAVEFVIGYVMQQRRQFHDVEVGVLTPGQPYCQGAYPVDVPPVVPGGITRLVRTWPSARSVRPAPRSRRIVAVRHRAAVG
jgi:hypothetical protein